MNGRDLGLLLCAVILAALLGIAAYSSILFTIEVGVYSVCLWECIKSFIKSKGNKR